MSLNASAVERIRAAFVEGRFDEVRTLVEQGVSAGSEPGSLLDEGLIPGLREVGEQFQRSEVYLPEMMLAADAWQEGMDVLAPLLAAEGRHDEAKGKVVLGSVKGDVHSLGKNIVATMLRTAGFEVIDLGTDVPEAKFIEEAERAKADIIALSALMTTTMAQQQAVIQSLEALGARDQYHVIVGGGPTNSAWAEEIGADAYGRTAADAVDLALAHMEAKP